MSGNTFGTLFKLTTFGESHGPGLGGVVDGCPPGLELSEALIQEELDRRKPGQGPASHRAQGRATAWKSSPACSRATPQARPSASSSAMRTSARATIPAIKDVYRPGHADLAYDAKYGLRDYRGGGRSSGPRDRLARGRGRHCRRAARRARHQGRGLHHRVGRHRGRGTRPLGRAGPPLLRPRRRGRGAASTPRVREVKSQGDTLGGIVEVRAAGVPAGLGEPVFDKLDARLAYALMSVGAVKAVEIGSGLAAARSTGSANNDPINPHGFGSNNAGGTLGGLSSGQDIVVRAAVKPIPSIAKGTNHHRQPTPPHHHPRGGADTTSPPSPASTPCSRPWSSSPWPICSCSKKRI